MSNQLIPRRTLYLSIACLFSAACNADGPSAINAPSLNPSPDVWVADGRPSAGNVEVCVTPSSPPGNYVLESTVEAPGEGAPGHGILYSPVTITLPGANCAVVFLRDQPGTPVFDDQSRVTTEFVSRPPSAIAAMDCRIDVGTIMPEDCVEVHTDVVHVHAFANFWHGTQAVFTFVPPPIFVVGDVQPHAVGNTVNFWGAQWWKNNFMSGFVASGVAEWKGFATDAGTCGDQWYSRPGDSSRPPSMIDGTIAVIVTSAVTKSGAEISGPIEQILLVDVAPGYGPNPGHAGRGTVKSVVCTTE
jgi:hypothetical protein